MICQKTENKESFINAGLHDFMLKFYGGTVKGKGGVMMN